MSAGVWTEAGASRHPRTAGAQLEEFPACGAGLDRSRSELLERESQSSSSWAATPWFLSREFNLRYLEAIADPTSESGLLELGVLELSCVLGVPAGISAMRP